MSLLLVGSTNAAVGMDDGMDVLRYGGSAIDAVVATIRRVEANPDDHSVGYGGLPNLLGQVELDASLMDGSNLATGAVAALQNYQDAIALAAAVMNDLPHVLIVGAGAERLAEDVGLTREGSADSGSPGDLAVPARRQTPRAVPTRQRLRELAGRLSQRPGAAG